MPGYYDIDAILAEEELLTVKPNWDFDHLAHLDPDSRRVALSRKRRRSDDDDKGDGGGGSRGGGHHQLPSGTKVKMPLWSVDKWATLGFVKVPALPRHYRQRMKERLEADPVAMNLCNKNDHYFLSGILLADLLLRTVRAYRRENPSRRGSGSAAALAMEVLASQARALRGSLLSTMMGDRLCRNFDWTLSALDSMEDDVSEWVARLSVLERKMFERGVEASGAAARWREWGCGRMGVSGAASRMLRSREGSGRAGATPAAGGGRREERGRVVSPVGDGKGRSF